MKKKMSVILAVILTTTLVFGCFTAFATTNQQKLNSVNQKLSSAKKQLNQSKKQEKELSYQINSLSTQINVTAESIIQKENEIEDTKNKIVQKTAELDQKSNEIIKQEKDLNKRLRAMYKNGEVGYLEVLLGSESFSELMNNIDMISRIYKQDEDFMGLLQDEYDELAKTKSELEALDSQLEAQQAQLKVQKQLYESQKNQAEVKKTQVQASIEEQSERIDDLSDEAEQITALIKEEQRRAAEAAARKSQASSGKSTSSSGSTAVYSTKFTGGKFCIPAPSYTRVSSGYGYRIHPISGTRRLHTGIDFAAATGTSCVAAGAGTVIYAGWYSGYGNTVIIDHGGGISTLYGHNSSICVSKGQSVSKGQLIARIGSTGNSTGPHCHFEVRVNGNCVNPSSYLGG